MDRYRYKAINENGRPVRGMVAAANEADLYKQLQSAGLELVACARAGTRKSLLPGRLAVRRVRIRDLIQFFIHLEQMQAAGVPMLDSLADIRDSTESGYMRDVVTEIHRDVSDGSALSEAMEKHPRVFSHLYVSLIRAGEETGDLVRVYRELIRYLKWLDEMRSRVRRATRYPMIVTVVVLAAVVIMMGYVVPQITGFLHNLGRDLTFVTTSLIATSQFFQKFWWGILAAPFVLAAGIHTLRRMSTGFAYHIDRLTLRLPVIGTLVRKMSISRYAQTFGALFAGGIDIMTALRSARKTVSNRALVEALETVEKKVQAGSPLSEAFNASGEFPSMVVRMLKIGEESGKLSTVLAQVSEFYTKDVDEAVQGLIALIEPILTAILGAMILWIAVAVFGPIYDMLGELDI